MSPRNERSFTAVNCGAIPEQLLESELFGHTKGAFPGATSDHAGLFELADGGTLFLDEIADVTPGLQSKILRVLEEGQVRRLGGRDSRKIDVRVLAATGRPVEQAVERGEFRSDLYYRLNVIPLTLPPLRQRAEDIRELAEYFVRLYASPTRPLRLTSEFLDRLEVHIWPGNVRELANCLRRVVALATSTEIDVAALEESDWNLAVPASTPAGESSLRPGVSVGEMERKLFEMTLQSTGGNRSHAAELLGVSLRTVRNKIRSYGLPSCSSYVRE
jgi:DNA-binding NtrC family response regulator